MSVNVGFGWINHSFLFLSPTSKRIVLEYSATMSQVLHLRRKFLWMRGYRSNHSGFCRRFWCLPFVQQTTEVLWQDERCLSYEDEVLVYLWLTSSPRLVFRGAGPPRVDFAYFLLWKRPVVLMWWRLDASPYVSLGFLKLAVWGRHKVTCVSNSVVAKVEYEDMM